MATRIALKFARNCFLNRNAKPNNVPRHYFCTGASTASAPTPPPPTRKKVPHFSKKVRFFSFIPVYVVLFREFFAFNLSKCNILIRLSERAKRELEIVFFSSRYLDLM